MNDIFLFTFLYMHVICFYKKWWNITCTVLSNLFISLEIVLLFSLSGVLRENAGSTAGPGDLQTV